MNSIHDLAEQHCAHLPTEARDMFMLGFNAGLSAGCAGDDTAAYLRSLIAAEEAAQAAGYLHGLAATRPKTSARCSGVCSHSLCHTVRKEQARRDANRLKAGVS